MLAALKNFFSSKKALSNERAKSRLHFVLVQDRTGLTGDEMAKFKEELIGVMEKYFVIDKGGLDIAYERGKGTTTLLINSPVVVRRQETSDKRVGARHNYRKKNKKHQQMGQPAAQATVQTATVTTPNTVKNAAESR